MLAIHECTREAVPVSRAEEVLRIVRYLPSFAGGIFTYSYPSLYPSLDVRIRGGGLFDGSQVHRRTSYLAAAAAKTAARNTNMRNICRRSTLAHSDFDMRYFAQGTAKSAKRTTGQKEELSPAERVRSAGSLPARPSPFWQLFRQGSGCVDQIDTDGVGHVLQFRESVFISQQGLGFADLHQRARWDTVADQNQGAPPVVLARHPGKALEVLILSLADEVLRA